jgi:Cu-Zn family superoxide dismutase
MTRRAAAFTLAAVLAAGCSNMHFGSPPPPGPEPKAAKAEEMGQVAVLRPIGGSAVSGKIRVVDRGDVASVLVSVTNFPTNAYRLVFHERGNCTSPNGFSAGAPWAPASSAKRGEDLVDVQYANSESRAESEFRVRGLHATGPDGVAGRSVVLYAGPVVTIARPDVPNAAIACGVFETARSIF